MWLSIPPQYIQSYYSSLFQHLSESDVAFNQLCRQVSFHYTVTLQLGNNTNRVSKKGSFFQISMHFSKFTPYN